MEQEKDILARLREDGDARCPYCSVTPKEAADEIERLRRELAGFYYRFACELSLGEGRGSFEEWDRQADEFIREIRDKERHW